jgi:hypothetical protein
LFSSKLIKKYPMKRTLYPIVFSFIVLIAAPVLNAQVLVSDNPAATADPAAMLDIQSTSKGLLVPRMSTAQRNVIPSPPTSMIIYQTNGTPGLYYNMGTPATPDWQRITDATAPVGLWSQTGSDIYYDLGNVGINTNSPSAELDVYGSIWAFDSIYVDGRPGRLFINGQTAYEPAIRFGYEGNADFKLHIDDPASNPYLSITSDQVEDLWGINMVGTVWHDYAGTGAAPAYALFSDDEFPTLYIDNWGITGSANCIQAVLRDPGADPNSTVIGGWNKGDGNGVYGEYDHDAPTYSNFGYLGTDNNGAYGHFKIGSTTEATYGALGSSGSGAWGVHDNSDNQGNLGLSSFGVQGTHGTSDYWGAIGGSTWGVYARMTPDGSSQVLADGDFAIKGVGVEIGSLGNRGANYALGNQVGGIEGYNTAGTRYSAGVAGYTDDDDADGRTSGVFGGIEDASAWGALGYENSSNNNYGGYMTTTSPGAKSNNGMASSIGLGAYGDLFGAHVDGEVYGLYASGGEYAMYSDGDVYKTGADVHLQTDNSGQNNVMYTLVSPDMTIQTYGIGQLSGGKSSIQFDDAFANVVSDNEPIVVTITPIGASEGVYLQNVDSKGFSVVENRDGKSNVQFSWIAIGKRSGYENRSLPQDVIASDYNTKIQTGLHNDADVSSDGEGLYYENGKLIVGSPPNTKSNFVSTEEKTDAVKIERKSMNALEQQKVDKNTAVKAGTPDNN